MSQWSLLFGCHVCLACIEKTLSAAIRVYTRGFTGHRGGPPGLTRLLVSAIDVLAGLVSISWRFAAPSSCCWASLDSFIGVLAGLLLTIARRFAVDVIAEIVSITRLFAIGLMAGLVSITRLRHRPDGRACIDYSSGLLDYSCHRLLAGLASTTRAIGPLAGLASTNRLCHRSVRRA